MAYAALLALSIMRDDFSRLDRSALASHVKGLQQADGRCVCDAGESLKSSFLGVRGQPDCDVRFTYCAFAVAYMLNDWTIFNVDAAVAFALRCRVRLPASQSNRSDMTPHSRSCPTSSRTVAQRTASSRLSRSRSASAT